MSYRHFLFLILLLSFSTLSSAQSPKREVRGVWISTILKLDLSCTKCTSPCQTIDSLKSEITQLKKAGFNAIFFQVRPSADAFYPSLGEPWSGYFTGEQGKGPTPFCDPLEELLHHTHSLGMEFHAWFNPFRVIHNTTRDSLKVNHPLKSKPQWLLTYQNQLMLNPGVPAARRYVCERILEVAQRYDVDGIHLDDYFYPYPTQGTVNDSLAFSQFGNEQSVSDWRRGNISHFIDTLSTLLKKTKPWLKFGVSPFGVWRNYSVDKEGSKTQAGFTCYDDLYADVRLWLKNGWIDYVCPQNYFSIGYEKADYKEISNWWAQNSYGRHVYIGHSPYKILDNADKNWDNPSQIPSQIRLNREISEIKGSVFFRLEHLKKNPAGLKDSLEHSFYKNMAFMPLMPWKDAMPPSNPIGFWVQPIDKGVSIQVQLDPLDTDSRYIALYKFEKGTKVNRTETSNLIYFQQIKDKDFQYIDTEIEVGKTYFYSVHTMDRIQNESSGILSLPMKYKKKYQKKKVYLNQARR